MNQTLNKLYNIQFGFQTNLFPYIEQELGHLSNLQQKFIKVLEVSQIDSHVPYVGIRNCRPTKSRMALVRAFIAKAVYNMPTTQILIDRLKSDLSLRRLCGYEKLNQVPSQSTFSRAFDEFSTMQIAERAHESIIKEYLSHQLIGHISRDSTAIKAREKSLKKPTKEQLAVKKRGRPKKGEQRVKEHSKSLGHVPIIDTRPKRGQKTAVENELKAKRNVNYKTSQMLRYNQRSSVERLNGRLKDEFNGRMVRVKGHAKVMSHLMFGIIALTVDQLMKFLE